MEIGVKCRWQKKGTAKWTTTSFQDNYFKYSRYARLFSTFSSCFFTYPITLFRYAPKGVGFYCKVAIVAPSPPSSKPAIKVWRTFLCCAK